MCSDISDWVFACLYLLEALIRLIAAGPRLYIHDGWNIFDAVIVITSFCDLAVVQPDASILFKIGRVMRIFKLARMSQGLQVLLNTLLLSFESVIYAAGFLFLLLYVFAILGVSLWAKVKLNGELNDYQNFQNFGLALLTLFRMSTGEAWNEVMRACQIQPPNCDPDLV